MIIAINNTTIYNIICSELNNDGMSEFENGRNIVFFNENFQYIKKIMKFDKDVANIVNKIIFQGEGLRDQKNDIHFKKTFCNKFLNRQINRQTVEDFSAQVLYTFFIHEEYLNLVYEEIDNFVKNKNLNNSKGLTKKINDNRVLTSDLPRDNVNLNVDDTVLNYGNQNTISRNKDTSEQNNDNVGVNYNIENLKKVKNLLEPVFNEFDKNCFMQIF